MLGRDRGHQKDGPKRRRKTRKDWGEGQKTQYPKVKGNFAFWLHGCNPLLRQPSVRWEYNEYLRDDYEDMLDLMCAADDWSDDGDDLGESVYCYTSSWFVKPPIQRGHRRSHTPYYAVHDEDCAECVSIEAETDWRDDYRVLGITT